MALTEELVDNFTTQDAAKWTFPAGTSVASGQISIPASTAYPTVTSAANYDLTSSSFYAQLVQPLDSAAGTQTYYDLTVSAGNSVGWMVETSGSLRSKHTISGTESIVQTVGAFNATTHKYLRIRYAGTTVTWEYSADAVIWTAAGTWTPTFALTSVQIGLGAGFFTAGTGTALWDNVNVPPAAAILQPYTARRRASNY